MSQAPSPACTPTKGPSRLQFNRQELAGAFGDIGTDLPLLVGLVLTCKLDPTAVFAVFGVLQLTTGLIYRMPMPVQPLKAMAAIMLAQKLPGGVLTAGGVVIGASMLFLAATGLLDRITRLVPKVVVRGIQLGLGLSLATVALKDYAAKDGWAGYVVAGVALLLLLALRNQRRIPGPLVVIALGAVYGFLSRPGSAFSPALRLPQLHAPTGGEWLQGALLLALPQLPLSLGNSVIATSQTSADLFPGRQVSVRKIGFTYALMNLIGPWFGGVPVCHGCGGMVGFYAFGARTGGAPVLYGLFYVVLGLFLAPGFESVLRLFPMPILGVVLLFEAVALMSLVRDVSSDRSKVWIALLVAVCVIALPYGYVVGLLVGSLLAWAVDRGWVRAPFAGPSSSIPSS